MELAWFIICVYLSSFLTYIFCIKRGMSGVLKIDHSDPNKDMYRLEIDDLNKLSNKTYVVLTIDNDADLSQK